ncbi:response regulator [Devosia sp.]|uniref:response regulator n=1 Tax=Devosia sp. TaxID=1871048 RepID=UPI003A936EC4
MVVEDDYLVVIDLIDQLFASGAEVIGPLTTVEEALAQLQSGLPISAAVLDVNLNGEEAWPVADKMLGMAVPFVFATAYDGADIPSRFDGVARYTKPATPTALVADLAAHLSVQTAA